MAAYLLAIRPNGILDSVGKLLTPAFALLILLLVLVGAVVYGHNDSAKTSVEYAGKAFGTGILAGYNTLDALAAVAFVWWPQKPSRNLDFKVKKNTSRLFG